MILLSQSVGCNFYHFCSLKPITFSRNRIRFQTLEISKCFTFQRKREIGDPVIQFRNPALGEYISAKSSNTREVGFGFFPSRRVTTTSGAAGRRGGISPVLPPFPFFSPSFSFALLRARFQACLGALGLRLRHLIFIPPPPPRRERRTTMPAATAFSHRAGA